jgi:NADH-quinone oxidoreductase subunit M
MGLLDDNLLTIITFFPLVTALGLLATSVLGVFLGTKGLPDPLWRAVAIACTLLTFLLSLRLFFSFDAVSTDFQFVEYTAWIPEYGINYFLGIDGISLFLVVLTTFLMPIVLLASWNDISTRVKSYVFFMLFLETGMLGAFVTLNLFAFYVFWELMLLPM